jgi:hypothetical protein
MEEDFPSPNLKKSGSALVIRPQEGKRFETARGGGGRGPFRVHLMK